jgi:hypothetical protein
VLRRLDGLGWLFTLPGASYLLHVRRAGLVRLRPIDRARVSKPCAERRARATTDGTSMSFLLAFLGALAAFLTICAIIYTYARHRLFPRLLKAGEAWAADHIGASFLKQVGIDPAHIDGDTFEACPVCHRSFTPKLEWVHICEEHGRCEGCPLVLDQMEAMEREQGLAAMSPFEIAELQRLRDLFPMEKRS